MNCCIYCYPKQVLLFTLYFHNITIMPRNVRQTMARLCLMSELIHSSEQIAFTNAKIDVFGRVTCM